MPRWAWSGSAPPSSPAPWSRAGPTCCAATSCRCSRRAPRSLRVLHLSDLHLTPWQRREREWVRGLAALEPDLVVDTGDNLAHVDAVPAVLDALAPLLERPGVFVLGSNDYYGPMPKNPARYLLRHGGKQAADRAPGCRRPSSSTGWPTPAGWTWTTARPAGRRRAGAVVRRGRRPAPGLRPVPRAGRAGRGRPGDRVDLPVGVLHAPYHARPGRDGRGRRAAAPRRAHARRPAAAAGVRRAGHQLRPGPPPGPRGEPLVDRRRPGPPPTTCPRTTPPGCTSSAGLGTSPYTPVRFCCRPEATLLTLTAP